MEKLKEIFDSLDGNGDGHVSRAEFIKALRRGDTGANALFGLSSTVRQEDGTRDAFERIYQSLDKDNSRSITWEEFVAVTRETLTLERVREEEPVQGAGVL
jgi:Ca2+-binding EF-hand superfamily protein